MTVGCKSITTVTVGPGTLRLMARGKKALPVEQSVRVLQVLTKVLAEKYKGNITLMAVDMEMSRPGLSQLVGKKNSPSYETACKLAALLRIDVVTLLGPLLPSVTIEVTPAPPSVVTDIRRKA